jgi:hypothetical protein
MDEVPVLSVRIVLNLMKIISAADRVFLPGVTVCHAGVMSVGFFDPERCQPP